MISWPCCSAGMNGSGGAGMKLAIVDNSSGAASARAMNSARGYQVVCVNTSKEVSTDDGCRDERAGAGRAGAGDGGGAGRGGQVGPGRFAGRVDGPSRRGLIAIDRGGRVFAGAGEAGVGGGPGCGADRPSGL